MNEKPGASRRIDPETSQDAAQSVDATWLENEVYKAIKRRGSQGATWYELYVLTGIALASISPRFRPLRFKGYIEARYNSNGVIKRAGPSGRRQIVWYARNPDQPTPRFTDKRMKAARDRVEARREARRTIDRDRDAEGRTDAKRYEGRQS